MLAFLVLAVLVASALREQNVDPANNLLSFSVRGSLCLAPPTLSASIQPVQPHAVSQLFQAQLTDDVPRSEDLIEEGRCWIQVALTVDKEKHAAALEIHSRMRSLESYH